MRYTREFEWEEDENTGEMGWIPAWLDGVESPFAGDGNLVAHDTLEHEANENDGDAENELRAIGAALYIRGDSGWFLDQSRSRFSNETVLASDITPVYEASRDSGDAIGNETNHPDPYEIADSVRKIVFLGIRDAILEHDSQDDGQRPQLAQFAASRREIEWLIIDGYTKAKERYPNEYAARDLFDRVSKAASEAGSVANDWGAGTLRIEVDTDECEFRAEVFTEENPTWGDLV